MPRLPWMGAASPVDFSEKSEADHSPTLRPSKGRATIVLHVSLPSAARLDGRALPDRPAIAGVSTLPRVMGRERSAPGVSDGRVDPGARARARSRRARPDAGPHARAGASRSSRKLGAGSMGTVYRARQATDGPRRRDQNPAERQRDGRDGQGALPPRGAGQQPARLAAHRHRLRLRAERSGRALPGDGAPRGRVARRSGSSAAAALPVAEPSTSRARRFARSPRRTRRASSTATSSPTTCSSRASRSATATPTIVKVLDFGIAKSRRRRRADGASRRRPAPSSARRATCRPSRAGQAARRAQRPLLARRHPLPDAHGPPALHRRRRGRRHGAPHQVDPKRRTRRAPTRTCRGSSKIVMRAISKDPDGRPANADDMAADLLKALEASGARRAGSARQSRTPPAFGSPTRCGRRQSRCRRRPRASRRRRSPASRSCSSPRRSRVIILVVAAGVYLGLRSGKPPSPPSREPAATATVSPPEPTTVTATSNPPVFAPDALPRPPSRSRRPSRRARSRTPREAARRRERRRRRAPRATRRRLLRRRRPTASSSSSLGRSRARGRRVVLAMKLEHSCLQRNPVALIVKSRKRVLKSCFGPSSTLGRGRARPYKRAPRCFESRPQVA